MRKLLSKPLSRLISCCAWPLLAFVFALALGSAHAQTITANISGSVTDSSGAVIPGAEVVASNVANGFVFKTTSNATGEYKIRFLPVGQYKVVITAAGFSKQTFGPFTLEIGQDAKLDAILKIGSASTNVQVDSGYAPILNTEDHTIATTLSTTAIDSLPLNGRNFSSLTMFLPGAVATSPSGLTGSNAYGRSTDQSGQTSVNGNRNQTNNYYLDGIEINETINNTIGYNPAPDSLGEVKVISANAPAEYGNVNGGDLIAVTKSGSNLFHGSVYYYLENYLLDANTWGNKHGSVITPKTHYTRPTFGATLGGPILKNKLFFFMDYEGLRYPTAGAATATVIPSAMRSGNLSSLSRQLWDNSSNSSTTAATAITSNTVTITNPIAIYLFKHPELYPVENTTATSGYMYKNYTGSTKGNVHNDQGDLRLDYKPNATDTITARYLQGEAFNGTTKGILPISFPTANSYPTKGIALNEVHQFSNALVNEFRAGFTRVRWVPGQPIDTSGAIGMNGNSLLGIGAIQAVTGFTGISFGCKGLKGCDSTNDVPSGFGSQYVVQTITDNTFQYGDNLTWLHGHHTLKAGLEITRYQQNNAYSGNNGANGFFTYYEEATQNATSQTAGYPIADFMLDKGGYIGRGGVDSSGNLVSGNGQRQYRAGYFVQDDFKFRPNLTFNIGVRYEYDQPIYEVHDKQANLNFDTHTVMLAGKNGNSRALYNSTYTNFMPRLGFNYQPNNKIVVRGGIGLTTYLEGTGANLRLPYNNPYWNESEITFSVPTSTSAGTFFKAANGFSSASALGSKYRAWYGVKPSVITEWSLASEYAITNATNLTVAYVGEQGNHLIQAVNYNQLTTPCGTTSAYSYNSATCIAAQKSPWYSLVGQSGMVVGTSSFAVMNYHAMQTSLRHHMSRGLEFTVNYTWSHSMTNSVGFFGVSGVSVNSAYAQNAYNNKGEYGPAGWDIRHGMNGNVVYELPFGKGHQFGGNWNRAVDEVAGGWKLAMTGVRYTGFPVTINGTNNSNTGPATGRPNHLRSLVVKNRNIDHWFGTDATATGCSTRDTNNAVIDNGTCAYANTNYGTFGNTYPGTERAPGYLNFDMSAYKDFQIYKDHRVSFRVDGFNFFNISSYGNPARTYSGSDFGKITTVRSSNRQFQLAARYIF